jgi:hypothetical protein
MRFHFCHNDCYSAWQERRHDEDVVSWLREASGVRAKILKRHRDDRVAKADVAEDSGDGPPRVRNRPDSQVSMSPSNELPHEGALSDSGRSTHSDLA